MVESGSVCIRLARLADVPALNQLIAQSVRRLGAADYNPQQLESGLKYIFGVDTQLIADHTFYVAETHDTIVGCGGWSRRKTLFGGDQAKDACYDEMLDPTCDPAKIRAFFVHPDWARRGIGGRIMRMCEMTARELGFMRLELLATLTGKPLYCHHGFVEIAHLDLELPDGVLFPTVKMEKKLTAATQASVTLCL